MVGLECEQQVRWHLGPCLLQKGGLAADLYARPETSSYTKSQSLSTTGTPCNCATMMVLKAESMKYLSGGSSRSGARFDVEHWSVDTTKSFPLIIYVRRPTTNHIASPLAA